MRARSLLAAMDIMGAAAIRGWRLSVAAFGRLLFVPTGFCPSSRENNYGAR